MKISYNWIKTLIPELTETPEELREKLSRSLAEVESLTKIGDDFVFEIENKALNHRADLFGEIGLAREISAMTGNNLTLSNDSPLEPATGKLNQGTLEKVAIVDPNLCPRYSAIVIRGIRVGESPKYLKERLIALGMRPVNSIVDVTNYVMLKYGQPLHAFDLAKFPNFQDTFSIEIRPATEGEKLKLIDEHELTLTSKDLVIAHTNAQGSTAVALAGIMGGKSTEIDATTTDVLLESANFNMYAVRTTSRRHGVRSDASLRFEKGLDPEQTVNALIDAASIITNLSITENEILDTYPNRQIIPELIELDMDTVNHYFNTNLEITTVNDQLERLGFATKISSSKLSVTIPTFRKDIKITEDLFEEIGRLYDYNRITPTLPTRSLKPPADNLLWDLSYKVRETLTKLGFDEILTYSFIDTKEASLISSITNNQVTINKVKPDGLKVVNATAPEFAYLRSSLIPSAIFAITENTKRFREITLFELGAVNLPSLDTKLTPEPFMLCLSAYAEGQDSNLTLRNIKGRWQKLVRTCGFPARLLNLQPYVHRSDELKSPVFIYEVRLDDILEELTAPRFKSIPLSPSAYQDLSFLIVDTQAVGPVMESIEQLGGEFLHQIELIDLFQSDTMKQNQQKSITLRLHFQHPTQSLSDKDLTPIREHIATYLTEKYQAVIR